MPSAKYAAWLVLLNAWLSVGATVSGAAQAKHAPSQRGGQAASHMSTKGSANSNAQWSADPERGWVRAEERHSTNDPRTGVQQRSQKKAKQNDKGKKF